MLYNFDSTSIVLFNRRCSAWFSFKVLQAVHIGSNFDVKNKLSTLIYNYSTPGITRSTPQGYEPVLTNHWLRFKIV